MLSNFIAPSFDFTVIPPRHVIDSGANSRQLLGFYQFNGAMFTGLYILTGSETLFTEAEAAKWLTVAANMAQRLQQK